MSTWHSHHRAVSSCGPTYHEPKALFQGSLIGGRTRRHADRSWRLVAPECALVRVAEVVYLSEGCSESLPSSPLSHVDGKIRPQSAAIHGATYVIADMRSNGEKVGRKMDIGSRNTWSLACRHTMESCQTLNRGAFFPRVNLDVRHCCRCITGHSQQTHTLLPCSLSLLPDPAK